MAIRRILHINDPEDRKILKAKAREMKLPVKGLDQLIQDMFETMRAANGVGLAAPQIGLSQRIVVIETPEITETDENGKEVVVEESESYVLINPVIVKSSKELISWNEGCLSLPGWYGDVIRPEWVTVEYTDPNGKRMRLRKADGWLGRIVQHEIDHLDGIMFTERMEDITQLREVKPDQEVENETV